MSVSQASPEAGSADELVSVEAWMRAHDRFVTGVAERVNRELHTEGIVYISAQELDAIAEETSTPEHVARAAARELHDQGALDA